jgi:enolase
MGEEETAKAVAYAEKWEIQSTFEDALTNLLVAHPSDPMGFLYDQIVSKAAAPTIDKIVGREIIGSQGTPTVEVEVWGFVYGKSSLLGTAVAPSCDFCPPDDAFILIDNHPARFHGRGHRQAVSTVTSVLQPCLEHRQFFDQKDLDTAIFQSDGTPNCRKIGVNTAIAASAALAISAARLFRLPLFVHLSRTIGGGARPAMPRMAVSMFNIASGPISRVFLLPVAGAPVDDQVRIIGEIYGHYEQAMHCPVCNDGGFSLEASTIDDILAAVEIAVSGGGHTLGDDVFLGLRGSAEATAAFWTDVFQQSQVVAYVEDPLPFQDTLGWGQVVRSAREKVIIAMGKGLFSKSERISPELAASAVIVRPVEAATLTRAGEAVAQIERSSKRCVVATSEREAEDSWICDFAAGLGAAMIVLGPMAKGENIIKVNRLLEISREIEVDYAQ